MKVFISSLFLLLSFQVFAQHRIAIYDVELDKRATETVLLTDVSSYIVGAYANDDRFIVIDKSNIQLIKNEQDRQKSEEFIDGYIVDQGKQEGFDYCYYPKYFKKDKSLSIRVYDIAKGTVITNQSVKVKNSIIGLPKGMKAAINKVIEKVNISCFEMHYEVLRCTDKKQKADAKNLLFAIGSNQRAKKNDEYDIYTLVKEQVGKKEIERKEIIGSGKISEIQDGNFSTLKVSKGGKEIMTALKSGQQLYGSLSL